MDELRQAMCDALSSGRLSSAQVLDMAADSLLDATCPIELEDGAAKDALMRDIVVRLQGLAKEAEQGGL